MDILHSYELNTGRDHLYIVAKLSGAATELMSFIKLLLSTWIFTQQE
jgi:hypothetical protein